MEIKDAVKAMLSEMALSNAWEYVQPGYGEISGTVVLNSKAGYLRATFPLSRRELDGDYKQTLKKKIQDAISNAQEV